MFEDAKIKKLVSKFNDDIKNSRPMLGIPQRTEAKEAAKYGEKAIEYIKPALSVSTDAHYALGLIGGDKAFNVLVEELEAYDPKRVNSAATALANMGDMRAIQYIKNSSLDSMRVGDLISFIKKKNDVSLNDDIDANNPLGQLKEKWTEFNGLKVNLSLGSAHRYRGQQKEALEFLNRYKDQMETLNFSSTNDKLHAWRMLGILLYYLNNPDDNGFYSKCEEAEYCFRKYLEIKPDEADIIKMLDSVKGR